MKWRTNGEELRIPSVHLRVENDFSISCATWELIFLITFQTPNQLNSFCSFFWCRQRFMWRWFSINRLFVRFAVVVDIKIKLTLWIRMKKYLHMSYSHTGVGRICRIIKMKNYKCWIFWFHLRVIIIILARIILFIIKHNFVDFIIYTIFASQCAIKNRNE